MKESSDDAGDLGVAVTEGEEQLEPMKAKVPFTIFAVAAIAQLAAVLAIYWLVAPRALRAELAEPWQILLWTFLAGIPLSLFEYLYHRYLLHSAVLPFLSSMQKAHVTHHGLTNVKAAVRAAEPEMLATVDSEFPVEEQHQEESMMFPLYSGLIFEAVFIVALGLPLKLLLPGQPILISVILTVILYYSAYEVWHALLHLPFDRFWAPKMKYSIVRRIYGFHLMHHWRPTANQAIVGFWGVAVWDHLFRTHHRPERMPLNKAQVRYRDSSFRRPRWPISMLDGWQGGLARSARRIEHFLAFLFSRRRGSPK